MKDLWQLSAPVEERISLHTLRYERTPMLKRGNSEIIYDVIRGSFLAHFPHP